MEVEEEDCSDQYDLVDMKHYLRAELKYLQDWQWFEGINQHRSISENELASAIDRRLGGEFRRWYIAQFKHDPSKVREKGKMLSGVVQE